MTMSSHGQGVYSSFALCRGNVGRGDQCDRTDGANDRGATIVAVRHHLGMKLGEPFQFHPVGQVVEGVGNGHLEVLLRGGENDI